MKGIGLVTLLSLFAGCQLGRSRQVTSSVSQALDSPDLRSFVLYAERSLRLGAHDDLDGGAAVALAAPPSFGAQLTLGDHVAAGDLYAPSVALGDHSAAAHVASGAIDQGIHVAIASTGPFPAAAMPSLPLAPAAAPGPGEVDVIGSQQLAPGAYGLLDDEGVVSLAPGSYAFADVHVGPHAVLRAVGPVEVRIAGTLSVDDHGVISAASASSLRLDISG